MHSTNLAPAGLAVLYEPKADGNWIKGRVVENGAKTLVREGVYKAFSVGIAAPRVVKDMGAPNGRIVDGRIVEVSLVDVPANPSCAFELVKASRRKGLPYNTGHLVVDKIGVVERFKGSNPSAPAVDDPDTRDQNEDSSADGTADMRTQTTDSTSSKPGKKPRRGRKPLQAQDGKVDLSDEGREAAADAGEAMSGAEGGNRGSYPIDSPESLSDAIQSVGRAKNKPAARRHIMDRAKDLGMTDKIPENWNEDGSTKLVIPRRLKFVHDALCAAYSPDSVKTLYPVLAKDGLASVIGPSVVNALFAMLQNEIAEDGGSGTYADNIGALGKAYEKIVEYLISDVPEDAKVAAMDEARVMLHKAWQDANPNVSIPLPSSQGVPSPGSYTRAFIRAGRYRWDSSGAPSPGLPGGAGNVSPSQFRRAALTADHYRPQATKAAPPIGPPSATGAPADPISGASSQPNIGQTPDPKPGPPYSGQELNDWYAKEQAIVVGQVLHDWLQHRFPEACPTGHGDPVLFDVKQTSFPTNANPIQPGAQASVPSAKALEIERVPGQPEPPTSAAAAVAAFKANADAGLVPKADVQKIVDEAVRKATSVKDKTINKLQAEVEKLGAEPDPAQAPHRGGLRERSLVTKTQKQEESPEQAALKAELKEAERFEKYLTRLADYSPDPTIAANAANKLESVQVKKQEIITKLAKLGGEQPNGEVVVTKVEGN